MSTPGKRNGEKRGKTRKAWMTKGKKERPGKGPR